ncbi:MAG: DUF4268 domain-containing protein [Bacteroidales bacterium]|jgi:hypothetical protein|nr:DUF4268 domain-containing protein [Bacteroidales bacterium]
MYSKEETQRLKKEFWDIFSSKTGKIKEESGSKKRWMLGKTGIKGISLKFVVDKRFVEVALEVSNKQKRERIFEIISSYRAVIEETLGDDFVWDNDYKVVIDGGEFAISRIYIKLEGVSYFNKSDWNNIHSFFITNMLKLESAYKDVYDILKEAIK